VTRCPASPAGGGRRALARQVGMCRVALFLTHAARPVAEHFSAPLIPSVLSQFESCCVPICTPRPDLSLKGQYHCAAFWISLTTGLGDLRKESPCHIEPSLPLPQRASFASHVLPPRLWRIGEAVLASAATMAVSIVEAPIVGPMCGEVWVQQPLVQPPLARQWRPRITMAAIITVPRAGIIRIRPAIELRRDTDEANCGVHASEARRRAVVVQ
jgi:hypothetical protein